MEATTQPSGPNQQAGEGFFASLMDTRFDNLITPKLIRFLYVISMVVLAIGTVVFIISGFADKIGTGILMLIIAPLVALIYLIVVRLWLELIVVTFKIREAADAIAGNTQSKA